MTSAAFTENKVSDKQQIKKASNAALASLLNLTFLPGIAFIWLLLAAKNNATKNVESEDINRYHIQFAIKLNIAAALALVLVSGLMILLGGFNSAWTWVYVITYFTFVHTTFIVIAIWALTRAWSGLRLNKIAL